MAKQVKPISLQDALDYCLQSDESDIDSSVEGLSSAEEDEINDLLTHQHSSCSERYGINIFFTFFNNNAVYPLATFSSYHCMNYSFSWINFILNSMFHSSH